MRLIHKHKNYLMFLAVLLFIFSLAGGSRTLAQDEAAFVRLVRIFDVDNIGELNPAGLAFSPGASDFLVLEADRPPQPPSPVSDIIRITPFEDRGGFVAIAAVVSDPINMAFDSKANRLLLIDSTSNELIEIKARSDGSLEPTALARHDAQHFGLINPQGMAVDPASGHLFILDNVGPRLVRVEPGPDQGFDTAVISAVDLQPTGLVDVRGLALDPTTGHLHLFSPAGQALIELTQTGQPIASRDLSDLELGNPQGMVFAPSGDLTDDPLQMNLYLADSGLGTGPSQAASSLESMQTVQSGYRIYLPLVMASSGDGGGNGGQSKPGKIIELSFVEPVYPDHQVEAAFTASLVQTINAWQWSPPSPDSAGVVYLPASNTLLVSDSEVNEIPAIFTGDNLFESTLTGTLTNTLTTISFSTEPTGVTLDPSNGHLFFSDDTGQKSIFEMDPGPDGLYDTTDDIITSTVTADFGSYDPEGVTFASGLGALFITDGVNKEIYQVTPGANGFFDGVPPAGDDQVTNFDTAVLGLIDPEGIAYNPDSGHLYAVGNPIDTLFELTTAGTLVQLIDVSAANVVNPAGLAYAPSSQNPAEMHIYIADRGVDNNTNPDENDGTLYEMTLPPSPSENVPPVANDDSTITTQETPVTINVAANDSDLNGNLDPTSANTTCAHGSIGCADPVNGSLFNIGDGTFTYTPTLSFAGNDTLVYEICDTELLCNTATATITVSAQQTLYVSSNSGGMIGNITFDDEDVLAYDLGTRTWSMYFDGSDVGLGTPSGQEIDALYVHSDGSILLSLGTTATIPDVGSVDDFDIISFIPTSTGETTAGSYELYFDGEDVGLAGEDIDAVGFAPDGRLVMSTRDAFSVGGIGGQDEDLIIFTATSLGATTSGSWDIYFDGSDVALDTSANEDVNGTWIDGNDDIYLTARGAFTATGVAGDGDDIFICVPGSTGDNTSCTFSPFWDGAANGFAGEILNDFSLGGAQSNDPPVADFNSIPTSGEAPLLVFFSDRSTNSPTAWSWTLGDGTASSLQNPSHTYTETGVYTVTLTASNAAGPDTITKTDYITVTLTPPVADFSGTPTSGAVPLDVSFSDESTGNPTAWSWSFGDGAILDVQDPGHTYTETGVYTVTLTASNAAGSDTITKTDYITVNSADSGTILWGDFGTDEDGFVYLDDAFRDTSQPGYADGVRIDPGGFSGGALQVTVGNIDDLDILGMSGGWQRSFTLSGPAEVNLSFLYNLTQAPNFESDELSQALVSVDGTLYGEAPNDYVAQIVGDGNGGSSQTTGWQLFRVNLGTLPAGAHTLTIGSYNNKKTLNDASTEILIDDVLVAVRTPVEEEPSAEVTITVNAGPDQAISLPNTATLDGTVTVDGLPTSPGAVTTIWSQVSGPSTVTFADPNTVDTAASFSAAGTYVLRLTAGDGQLTTFDELAVAVNSGK